jgi:hypothetical protein
VCEIGPHATFVERGGRYSARGLFSETKNYGDITVDYTQICEFFGCVWGDSLPRAVS